MSTEQSTTNGKLKTIKIGSNSYDLLVDKDWQEQDSLSVKYIADRTHHVKFKLTSDGQPAKQTAQINDQAYAPSFAFRVCDGITNGKPNAAGKTFLVRGPHYFKERADASKFSVETVSYAIYIPELQAEHSDPAHTHPLLEIELPLLNSTRTVSTDEPTKLCYDIFNAFETKLQASYALSLVAGDHVKLSDLEIGEAEVKQLDAAYIPVDHKTIDVGDNGKLTVQPIAERLAAVENNLVYFITLFGTEDEFKRQSDLAAIIDENTLVAKKDDKDGKIKLSAKPLLGSEDDTAEKNTVYGAKAAVKALEESLKSIAKSGKAFDVSLEDLSNKITADNVEDALIELKDDITNSWNVLFGQDRQTIVLDGGTDGAESETAE